MTKVVEGQERRGVGVPRRREGWVDLEVEDKKLRREGRARGKEEGRNDSRRMTVVGCNNYGKDNNEKVQTTIGC